VIKDSCGCLSLARRPGQPGFQRAAIGVYGRVRQGPVAAVPPALAASPLAGRPYDLRHACLSTWLNAGVNPTQVAEWAGNTAEVLMRVYAKCIHGRDEINRKRIEDALRYDGGAPGDR